MNEYNFNNFFTSISTNLLIMLSENWGKIMAIAENKYQSRWVYWYAFIILFLGNLIILNLFIAILIENFKETKEQDINYCLYI